MYTVQVNQSKNNMNYTTVYRFTCYRHIGLQSLYFRFLDLKRYLNRSEIQFITHGGCSI